MVHRDGDRVRCRWWSARWCPSLEEAGTEQDQAAQSLGAGASQRFRRITLPTIRWALAYGVVLSLARSLGEFGAVRGRQRQRRGRVADADPVRQRQLPGVRPGCRHAAFAAAFVLMMVAVLFIVLIALLRPKEK